MEDWLVECGCGYGLLFRGDVDERRDTGLEKIGVEWIGENMR